MTVKLLTEHNLEFLSLKGGCTDSSESTLVKMPHCWKSHVTAHLITFPSLLQVHCMASGSNPAPVMSLMYNQQKPYIAPKYMNSTEGSQLKFTGHFDIAMEFDPQYGSEQTLTCSAHVPNKNFGKTKVAGLSLVVSIGKISIYAGVIKFRINQDFLIEHSCILDTSS